MLKASTLSHLSEKRNLLAFSAGVDSSALFFLLQDANISFDIAIVDYGLRQQSKEEVLYAQKLAKKFDIICHVLHAKSIDKNFEAQAREIRYNFFEELIDKHKYQNLLTAHHLGDRFEWMLMQFCKGAGCVEMSGMKEIQIRDNYTLIRPLLHLDKSELLEYLKLHSILYFEDESNLDMNITRNTFRHKHTNILLKEHLEGIKRSFNYIDKDVRKLSQEIEIHSIEALTYFRSSHDRLIDIRVIDKYLKQLSYMLSAKERESLELEKTFIVGRRFIINQANGFVFILPYQVEKITLSKEFKEECRVLQIEPKLRSYLFKNTRVFLQLKRLLTKITES